VLKKNLILSFLIILSGLCRAQSCTISIPDYICLGDLTGFNYTSTAVVQSVSWDFGDGNTSTLNSPFHQYASAGNFKVELTLSLTGGGSCTQTKNLDVYALPQANLSVNSVSLCLPRAVIQLTDNSSASDASRPLVKKLILWGDGAADSFNYTSGNKHSYTYLNSALNLPLLLDVRDSKGCRSQDSVKINVFAGIDDFDFYHDISFGCDSNILVFCNKSKYDTSIGMDFTWDIDGAVSPDNTKYDKTLGECLPGVVHVQNTSGAVVAKLSYTNKFGCKDTLVKILNYLTYDFTPGISKSLDTACLGSEYIFNAIDNANRSHSWDVGKGSGDPFNQNYGSEFRFEPNAPGQWVLLYTAKEKSCEKNIRDTIHVRGPAADMIIKNSVQCNVNDTVYFVDSTYTYLNNGYERLWNFKDPNAPQCTTDTRLGVNVGMNCNFSKDSCTSHFYSSRNCYIPTLYVEDTTHGCKDSATRIVNHGFMDQPPIILQNDRNGNPVYCEYENIGLLTPPDDCNAKIVSIYLDSANPNLKWERMKSPISYANKLPISPDGWVTFGVIRTLGNPARYSGAKGMNLTYDSTAICLDTVWIHKFLKVIAQPLVKPQILRVEDCAPFKATIGLKSKPSITVYRYVINWGDGSSTIDTIENQVFPDSFHHIYQKGIDANIRFYIESKTGCAGLGFVNIKHGTNSTFDFYKGRHTQPLFPLEDRTQNICLYDTLTFEDSAFYAGAFSSRWRENGVPETITWNFGDGSPQVLGAFPIFHQYKQYGAFEVLMMVMDSFGCIDTLKDQVLVPKVIAALEDPTDKIICGDITRLFDSSSIQFNYPTDSIHKWAWDFGDGDAPSFLKNPFRNYPKPGKYEIIHVAENTYGCRDTITSEIQVKGPDAYFEILSDTVACPNHWVEFDNMSMNSTNYIWNFGNVQNNILSTNKDSNVNFKYIQPGIYDIFLTAADSIFNPFTNDYSYCAVTFPDTSQANAPIRRIRIVPKRSVNFNMPDTVCANIPFVLADASDPIYSFYNWYIEGNQDSIKMINQEGKYAFTNEGNYTVTYRPGYIPLGVSEPVCPDTISKNVSVIGFNAGYDYKYEEECGHYTFRDTSDNTVIGYNWTFGHPNTGDNNFAQGKNVEHFYGLDTGTFEVCMAAESKYGCKDTICKEVSNDYYAYAKLFNVFTPNNDGFNDDYDILIENEVAYQINIYNRFGTLVFKGSNDGTPNDGNNWNGKIGNVGADCGEGTYYYKFTYQLNCSEDDSKRTVYGVISLMR